jgi:hypothetical protein
MPDKPSFASQYSREQAELVRQTCLYVATKLGDLLDELVVVGGLVPSLLIPERNPFQEVKPPMSGPWISIWGFPWHF